MLTPCCKRKPNFLIFSSITAVRPTKIGLAKPSSTTICTARNTRESSPSAYAIRLGSDFACEKIGFIKNAEL